MWDQRRHVLLMMHPWAGYLSGVQWGVADYLFQQPDWVCTRLSPIPRDFARLPHLKADGVIAFVQLDYVARLQRLNVPVVDVANWTAQQHFPRVLPDDEALGRLAAEHLLELRLRHFGILGPANAAFHELRRDGFQRRLAEEEMVATMPPRRGGRLPAGVKIPPVGSESLASWLLEMPKPAGILATTDDQAMVVLEVCHYLNIRVPEELCVLGVDNDELVARFAHPPLSSIAPPARRIGFEAARLLQRLMDGQAPPDRDILLPPTGVVARQSTNLLMIPDDDVREAVRYIRERVHAQVTVPDLLRVVPVNRRYLERKFQSLLGRTPLQEIRRVRVEKAKELLTASDLSYGAIARRSGFANARRLAEVFHATTGMTPTAYRRQTRVEDIDADL